MHRQWTILRLIYGRTRSVKELARECDVSTKTIRRDIGTMRTIFPILVTKPQGKSRSAAALERRLNLITVNMDRRQFLKAMNYRNRK